MYIWTTRIITSLSREAQKIMDGQTDKAIHRQLFSVIYFVYKKLWNFQICELRVLNYVFYPTKGMGGFGSPNLVFLQRVSYSLYLFLDGNAEFGILIDDVDENNVIIVGFDRQDPEQVGK